MKKAIILTTEELNGLEEIKDLCRCQIEVRKTNKIIPPKLNVYHNSVWGNFDWIREQLGGGHDIRCYATSRAFLKNVGIVNHIGMYDTLDDGKSIDFYFGIPSSKDRRAKANGFKTNEAWLFCHEYLHGREQMSGSPDRTHAMESQGRLKELLEEYRIKDMREEISFLEKVIVAIKRFLQK